MIKVFAYSIYRFRLVIIAVMISLGVFCAGIISDLKVDGDFTALLDSENAIVMEYAYAVENFKSPDSFLLLLENSLGQEKKIDFLIKELESVSSVEKVNKLDSSYLKKNQEQMTVLKFL